MRYAAVLVVLITLMACSLAFGQGSGYIAPQEETPAGQVMSAGAPETEQPAEPVAKGPIYNAPDYRDVESVTKDAMAGKYALAGHKHPQYITRSEARRHRITSHRHSRPVRTRTATRTVPAASKPPIVNVRVVVPPPLSGATAATAAITPAPAATTGGERGFEMPWYCILLIVVAGLTAIAGIASWFIRNGQEASENLANGRIPARRVGMAARNAPAPIGPTTGNGGVLHYDSRGRVVGWERWEYPANPGVQMVAAGTPAVIINAPGQAAQVVVLPQPAQPPHAKPQPTLPAPNANLGAAAAQPAAQPKADPIDPDAV